MISGLAIGAFALWNSWHEIEEVYDAQLIHAAKVLRQLTIHEFGEHEDDSIDLIPETADLGYKYEQNIAFRIWHAGAPMSRSNNAVSFGDLEAPPGLSEQNVDGEKWRFFVYVDSDSGITVETSERYEIRYELVQYLLLGLLLPASLFIPAVLILVWYGTSRGLRPLAALSRDVDTRDSNDLSSIRTERTPREIDPLVNALNRLLARLKEALDRERDFTDNAAHELRTPLAAIKTQAQALRRRVESLPQARDSLTNLLTSIDRASHLVDKLLSFSRLQKDRRASVPVDASSLLAEVVGELAADACDRDQTLSLNAEPNISTMGDRDALRILARNLVENAIKYTPDGGAITVSARVTGESVEILVEDNGPGIPDAEKQRALRRFHRVGSSESTGSGLGLAIVKWIADHHGGTLELSDADPAGLRCTVKLPAGRQP